MLSDQEYYIKDRRKPVESWQKKFADELINKSHLSLIEVLKFTNRTLDVVCGKQKSLKYRESFGPNSIEYIFDIYTYISIYIVEL